METKRLRQFCVVNQTNNLRKAAEILNMSHSALSKSLKVLQDELGLQLLEQHGRGIMITEDGKRFVKKAQALLDLEQQILSTTSVTENVFRIGSFESFSTHLIGMRWYKYFSETPLQIHELSSGQLEAAVLAGQIDAAITYEPVPMKDLEFINIGKIKMGVFHRKGLFKNLSFEKIPFVAPLIPAVGTPTTARGLDGWPEHEHPRNIRYRVDLMESGLALVRSGMCSIFIPDFVAKTQNEALSDEYKLIARAYPRDMKKIERRIFLVVLASRQKEKQIRDLVKMIGSECIDRIPSGSD